MVDFAEMCRTRKNKNYHRDGETMTRREEEKLTQRSQRPQTKKLRSARDYKSAFSVFSVISVFQNPFRTGPEISAPKCPGRRRDLPASLDHPIKSGDDGGVSGDDGGAPGDKAWNQNR
jgi:hypothetical protein